MHFFFAFYASCPPPPPRADKELLHWMWISNVFVKNWVWKGFIIISIIIIVVVVVVIIIIGLIGLWDPPQCPFGFCMEPVAPVHDCVVKRFYAAFSMTT